MPACPETAQAVIIWFFSHDFLNYLESLRELECLQLQGHFSLVAEQKPATFRRRDYFPFQSLSQVFSHVETVKQTNLDC